jgi:hypothetical protein
MAKEQMFCDFMNARSQKILAGDTEFYPANIQKMVNNRHPAHMEAVATAQAQADRSDPFTYRRVKSQLQNGVGRFSDYRAHFVPVNRLGGIKGDTMGTYMEAQKRTLPC